MCGAQLRAESEAGALGRGVLSASGARAPVQGDIGNTGDCYGFGKTQAWGADGWRGQSGLGGLIASSMVGGVTGPRSRRRISRKDAMRKQGGVRIVSPPGRPSRTPGLAGGEPTWEERV